MGGVYAEDVATSGGPDVLVGGICACKIEAEADTVGGVRASEADVDVEVDAEVELHVAHRGAKMKAR